MQPWIITKNGESYAALIDDARRGIADIEAVRTYGADAAIAQSGETRWPSAAQRRTQLQEGLDRALPAAAQRELMRAGASMTRDEAFTLALGDPPMRGNSVPD